MQILLCYETISDILADTVNAATNTLAFWVMTYIYQHAGEVLSL